ncbi:hypothetical protein F2Q69_00035274 [Brassica cretica]|uniref:Uncharacterized protein n=1 Tax=Brassica cretica TaxID=69181 RepID=A0A8S9SK39_BRACR|nr:hypothetical protein F2Q69_00035274 [Brassica cretica]
MEISWKEGKMEGQYMVESTQLCSNWSTLKGCEGNREDLGVINMRLGNLRDGIFQINLRGQLIVKSGGKKGEMARPGLRVTVPWFYNSELIASFSKTLIGRVVGTDLGIGRLQFAFELEEYIVESRCPELIKEGDATLKAGESAEAGAGATSFKAVVANESNQYGERREGQYGRSQGIQGARGSDKGKGIAREKHGHHKQDSSYQPYKEKFPRGYGEGSSFYGRHMGYVNKKTAFQSRDFQQQQRHDKGEHRPLNPTKLMVDAFKGVTGYHGTGGVKGIGTEGNGSSSKARVAVVKDALAVQEQGEVDEEAKVVAEQSLHSEALDEANLMIDGVILSDSELRVEGDDLEDCEQGEIMDFVRGFLCRIFKGGRSLGLVSGFLLAETWSVPLTGTREPGSCPEAGGNDTGVFFPNILPLISRCRHQTRGITCEIKSTGVAHSQQAPLRQDSAPSCLEFSGDDEAGDSSRWREPKSSICAGTPLGQRSNAGRVVLRVPLVPQIPRTRMKNEKGLDLGSSSTCTRVRSRDRVGNEARESMNSSESSLDLTTEIENLRVATFGDDPPSMGGDMLLPIGPLSVIGVGEVANWRRKFHLSDDIIIRIPGPFDRVSDFEAGEVPVYEGFFESGFRDQVPFLVAEVSKAMNISLGHLNPSSWRTLIAMQNLGDHEGLVIGVTEVLYCYSVSPLNGGEFRYFLRPRGKELPVRELSKAEKKRHPVFEGGWTSMFAFMPLPGLCSTWRAADIPRADYSSGGNVLEQLLELPIDRREVSFLVSDEALDRCSIRGVMSGSKGDEALAEYKKALEAMSTRKAASKRDAPGEDDKVQFIWSSKRQATTVTAPSSSKKKSKVSASALKSSPSASYDWSKVLANLNAKVFPLTPACPESFEDSSVAIRSLQGDVLQVTHHRPCVAFAIASS